MLWTRVGAHRTRRQRHSAATFSEIRGSLPDIMSVNTAVYVAGFLLLVISSAAHPTGRRLAQTSSSASSSSTVVGNGRSSATSIATSRNGGMSRSDVRAEARDGANVQATGRATAVDGGTAVTKVDAAGTEGATIDSSGESFAAGEDAAAILEQVLRARGNSELQASALSTAVNNGNGTVVADVLQSAFAMNSEFGAETTQVVANALANANGKGPEGSRSVAITIITATAQGGEKAAIFGQSISTLLAMEGCGNVRDAIAEADTIAVANGKFVERAFIEAMNVDVKIIQCLYPICTGEVVGCCSEAFRSVGRCFCDSSDPGALCKYRLFWQIPAPLWACQFNTPSCTAPKCMCPSA